VPWNADFRKQTALKALPKRNALAGSLGNVASLTVDAAAACLKDKPLTYDITTDGPASVTFNDGRSLRFTAAGRHRGTLARAVLGRCSRSGKVRFALHGSRSGRVVRVRVFVNGKPRLTRRGHNLRSVTIARLPHKRFTVKIVTTLSTGSKRVSTRKFAGCRKTAPRTRVIRPAR
jgi:hypothetical protein